MYVYATIVVRSVSPRGPPGDVGARSIRQRVLSVPLSACQCRANTDTEAGGTLDDVLGRPLRPVDLLSQLR
jgi:hypothetical protein